MLNKMKTKNLLVLTESSDMENVIVLPRPDFRSKSISAIVNVKINSKHTKMQNF